MNRTDSDDLSRGTNMRTYDFSMCGLASAGL